MFTVDGRYQSRGWTEWTQGFQFGSAVLQFDATGEPRVPRSGARADARHGWRRTSRTSASTITASTTSAPTAACGGWRVKAASTPAPWEIRFYELALKVSGAVQATALDRRCPTAATSTRSTARTRCSSIPSDRCARSALVAPARAPPVGGAGRARSTCSSGCSSTRARPPSTPSTTAAAATPTTCAAAPRTRASSTSPTARYRGPEQPAGLFAVFDLDPRPGLGHARLRRTARVPGDTSGRRAGAVRQDAQAIEAWMLEAARATCDFYIEHGDRRGRRALLGHRRARAWQRSATGPRVPPIRSTITSRSTAPRPRSPRRACFASAACSTRAARTARATSRPGCACSTRCSTSADRICRPAIAHQGLLLHSVYHRPNGWDHVPPGSRIPRGESSQWGDYHLREAALLCAGSRATSRTSRSSDAARALATRLEG